ncbi:hypothetical protein BJ912DRAFT_954036 [Pholiota molesta]|nr:hypothetical protein BJ912DRAFT_954036 [Pholiota molesta]
MAPEPAPPVPFIAAPTVVVHEPPPASTVNQDGSHSQKAASMAPAPEALPEVILQGQDDTISTSTHDSVPQIVLNEEVVKSSVEPTPHKTDFLMSPSLETGDTSVVSLTGMLGNYFATSPLSPFATLAYDGPETPDKPAKPTIEVPDPQSFLSPPPSGFRSALSSGGGSSISSMGSRPMSMIETSPGNVSRAMRMTPATSRGVPMFLPPTSAHPRKSDFAAEFGSATLHKSSQSLSLGSTHRASDMVINDPSARSNTTFTAVVHGKVRETPTTATLPASFKQQRRMPETPQMKRVQRMTMMEPPASPASGELAALLQEAVLLEDSLDRGELPTEANVRLEAEEKEKKEREAAAAAKARARASKAAEDEERQRIAAAGERLKAKRDEPTSGRLKHTFLAPTPQLEVFPSQQADPFIRPKSAGLPENQVQRPVTPENKNSAQYLETPPKSSRFASFRRLGSVTARPNTIHGHSNRYSVSTSSEDSAPVITPPDTHLEFGSSKHPTVGEFGQMPANGSTTSFPTLSPKKSSTSIGRAASFAERVFSRSRKQSNVSILSATSEMTVSTIDRIPEDAPSLPVLSIGPLPSTSYLLYQIRLHCQTKVLHPPKRSTSLARSSRLPPLPTEMVPPLPTITPSAFFFTTADAGDVSGNSLRTPHATADDVRPTSWTSMSSAGSLPSPLFDTSLFDAFPSVPEMTPALSATASLHRAPSRSIDPTISYDRPPLILIYSLLLSISLQPTNLLRLYSLLRASFRFVIKSIVLSTPSSKKGIEHDSKPRNKLNTKQVKFADE